MPRLDVVGIGINPWWHATRHVTALIAEADDVRYLAGDPLADRWVRQLNPKAASLASLYGEHDHRRAVYTAMVDLVLDRLRAGSTVCMVLYGHPGVYVTPGHEVIARARAEGFLATMHPAISAADCLYADLGVDPGRSGCLSLQASHLLDRTVRIDPAVALILWQIGVVGDTGTTFRSPPSGLDRLIERLLAIYGPKHLATVYEAATQPAFHARIETVPLADLAGVTLRQESTLYVPPLASPNDPTTN